MVSIEYREAIVEVLDILQYSDDYILDRIPKKLIEFWERNKSTTYKSNLDHSKPINEMNLKNKTKSLITMIYINYLCDETQKKNTQLILKNNEEKYQKKLREKYNPDGVFKNKKLLNENIENYSPKLPIEVKKNNFYQKIINYLKGFFHMI